MTPLNESEIINRPSPNQTPGRAGTPVRHITFHHIDGPVGAALTRFADPASQVSTHFAVGSSAIYCFVNTDNTAWGNGVWSSNLESISIEHEGDWRNGYRNEAVINNSARLVAWSRSLYPSATPNRHRDVYATACPGDLPVEEIWDKATQILNGNQGEEMAKITKEGADLLHWGFLYLPPGAAYEATFVGTDDWLGAVKLLANDPNRKALDAKLASIDKLKADNADLKAQLAKQPSAIDPATKAQIDQTSQDVGFIRALLNKIFK